MRLEVPLRIVQRQRRRGDITSPRHQWCRATYESCDTSGCRGDTVVSWRHPWRRGDTVASWGRGRRRGDTVGVVATPTASRRRGGVVGTPTASWCYDGVVATPCGVERGHFLRNSHSARARQLNAHELRLARVTAPPPPALSRIARACA